jgi:hypothetical protein
MEKQKSGIKLGKKSAGKSMKGTTKTVKALSSKDAPARGTGAKRPVSPAKGVPAKAVKTPAYERHPSNPFRPQSSYSKVFDVFSSFKQGVNRQDLLKAVSRFIGKDEMHSAYDLAVILSAKESNNGSRHKSCRPGYWCKKENSNVCLMID